MHIHSGNALRLPLLTLMTSLIIACGGGGGGGNDKNPTTGGGPGLPPDSNIVTPPTRGTPNDIAGLNTPDSPHRLLYFTQVHDDDDIESGLFAYDPESGTSTLKDSKLGLYLQNREQLINVPGQEEPIVLPLPGLEAQHYDQLILPFHAGTIKADRSISGFGIGHILYGYGCSNPSGSSGCLGYQRISTQPGHATPEAVSNATSSNAFTLAYLQHDLSSPLKGSVLHTSDGSQWKQFRLEDDGNTTPLSLPQNLYPVMPVHDQTTFAPKGYLVVDIDDEKTLKFVDMSLTLVGGAVTHQGVALKNIDAASAMGTSSDTADQYLMLGFEDDEDGDHFVVFGTSQATSLWRYTPTDGQGAGTIEPVLNSEGKSLSLPRALFAFNDDVSNIMLPSPAHITAQNGALFLARARRLGSNVFDGAVTQIVRIQGASWRSVHEVQNDVSIMGLASALLIAGKNHLALETDNTLQVMDHYGNHKQNLHFSSQQVTTPILGTDGEWIYFNGSTQDPRESGAIALRLDGSQRLVMPGWTWIGASLNGESASVQGQLHSSTINEVFMVNSNGQLAVLDASDPAAGKVNLGQLPNGAKTARLFGTAAGPHRLLQSIKEGAGDDDDNEYQVIYVDTREAGSLKVLSERPSRYATQRPVSGF